MRQKKESFNNNKKMNSEVKFADLLADESINGNTNPKSANTNMNDNIITPDFTNISKNAPCPCGSGKKFKMCCSTARLHSEVKQEKLKESDVRAEEIRANALSQKMIEDAERAERARVNKESANSLQTYYAIVPNASLLTREDRDDIVLFWTEESRKMFRVENDVKYVFHGDTLKRMGLTPTHQRKDEIDAIFARDGGLGCLKYLKDSDEIFQKTPIFRVSTQGELCVFELLTDEELKQVA